MAKQCVLLQACRLNLLRCLGSTHKQMHDLDHSSNCIRKKCRNRMKSSHSAGVYDQYHLDSHGSIKNFTESKIEKKIDVHKRHNTHNAVCAYNCLDVPTWFKWKIYFFGSCNLAIEWSIEFINPFFIQWPPQNQNCFNWTCTYSIL